jgi:hypothetical protein
VDLGAAYSIDKVMLWWENAYGKEYKVQVSTNASSWTDAAHITDGAPGKREIRFSPINGRYVRMYGIKRGISYGYSLWEFEVFSAATP